MICIYAFLACVMASCTKNTGNSNGNNGGNGGNGGGNNSTLSITGFTPLRPYVDDVITITGTGFNTDKTKDTVLINSARATVTSATSTQLVLKLPTEDDMDLSICNCALLQIWTNGKKVIDTTQEINFKRTFAVNYLVDPDNSGLGLGRPADSLIFSGSGFTKTGTTLTIDGKAVTIKKIDSSYYTTASIRLPKDFFGENNDETAAAFKNVVMTNSDGKTSQKSINFLLSPRMDVFSMTPSQGTYSLGALTSSGGVITVTVNGVNLKSDASVHFASNTGVNSQNPLQVSGFPNSTVLTYNPGGLVAGNYGVSIWRGNTLYGVCNFTLTN